MNGDNFLFALVDLCADLFEAERRYASKLSSYKQGLDVGTIEEDEYEALLEKARLGLDAEKAGIAKRYAKLATFMMRKVA